MESINVPSPAPSRHGHRRQTSSQSSGTSRPSRQLPGLACEECRRRKLRCDRKTPSCRSCLETGVVCVMPTTCPPRGPKKGHLRSLRERIGDDSEDGSERDPATPPQFFREPHQELLSDGYNAAPMSTGMPATPPQSTMTPPPTSIAWASPMIDPSLIFMDDTTDNGCFNLQSHTPNLDDLALPVGLQLTPLVCTDLDQLFFDRVHAFVPMIQKGQYLGWTKQLDKSKKQICLQYAMWTIAATHSSQFQALRDGLYSETRRVLDNLELEPSEQGVLSLEYIQAWLLIAVYEWSHNDYHRSLVSAGRAFRSVQLMRLHDLDGCVATASAASWTGDWVEMESARRTFWMAFMFDCFTATHGEVPLTFNESEIRTRLPAPDAQFSTGRDSVAMPFLSDILGRSGYQGVGYTGDFPTSPLVECIIAASLCGQNITHKNRSRTEQGYGGEMVFTQDFCHRHQWLDTLLTSRMKSLGADFGQDISFLTDPLMIFAALVVHMNVLFLGEVIDSMPLHTEMSHALRTKQEQKSLLAAEQMSKLATAVSHLDRSQVCSAQDSCSSLLESTNTNAMMQSHFFTSIPLSMAAKFYMLRPAPDEEFSPYLQNICGVLQNMTGNNNPTHDIQQPGATLGGFLG
ncbi:Transcription factor [Apiospora sp. TS-2023a]